MGELKYDLSRLEVLWSHAQILNADLEKIEYDKNFAGNEDFYISIFEDTPVYHSLMNFPEEQEVLQAEQSQDGDDDEISDEDNSDDRNSYRDIDQDNVYYLI